MSGRLAAIMPSTNTPTTLYTAPANTLCSVTVAACNQGITKDRVSIQICDGQADDEDYIEYNAEVGKSGVLERSGIVIANGQTVIVTTEKGQTSFVCWGIKEDL